MAGERRMCFSVAKGDSTLHDTLVHHDSMQNRWSENIVNDSLRNKLPVNIINDHVRGEVNGTDKFHMSTSNENVV